MKIVSQKKVMVTAMRIEKILGSDRVMVEGETFTDCFDKMASAVENMLAAAKCLSCDSTRTVPVVRNYQGNTYREMVCLDCGAKLGFGMRKADGELFPRRKKDGQDIGVGGWAKWIPKDNDEPTF